jgi:hypothetical protein
MTTTNIPAGHTEYNYEPDLRLSTHFNTYQLKVAGVTLNITPAQFIQLTEQVMGHWGLTPEAWMEASSFDASDLTSNIDRMKSNTPR